MKGTAGGWALQRASNWARHRKHKKRAEASVSAWGALALASRLPLRHSRDVQGRLQGSGGGPIAAARDEAGVASKREMLV